MKPVQVKMMQRKYGNCIFWVAYARGRSFGQYHDIGRAGAWMEFMVQSGFQAHPGSDVKPSGVLPVVDLYWHQDQVEKIKDMIANHPLRKK